MGRWSLRSVTSFLSNSNTCLHQLPNKGSLVSLNIGTNHHQIAFVSSKSSQLDNKASADVVPNQSHEAKKPTTKIGIAIRSFDQTNLWGLPPHTSKIRLPERRVLYTVLRSPHIDKKSREQFHMEFKKQFLVIKTHRDELRNKLFWLKRQRIFGAQYEIQLSCKTRLDKAKVKSLLSG